MEDRSCDWVVLLREYLESSGDTELVRELWPTLTRLLDWYRKRRTDRGLVLAREWEVWALALPGLRGRRLECNGLSGPRRCFRAG
jgi:hypothetical protein